MMTTIKNKALKTGIMLSTLIPATSLAADNSQTAACNGAEAVGGVCGGTNLTTRVGNIIDTLFFIVGTLAVLIMLVGAIRYVTSTGDAKRIQQAKDTIIYAIMGLIVAILARAIVGFVIGRLF